MKRTLIAACIAAGIVALSAADAQAIAIQFETTNIAGDVWQYSYFVTDFVFGADQALFIDFDSNLYSDLQDTTPLISDPQDHTSPPKPVWLTLILPTSDPSPPIVGDLLPGSFVAEALVKGASLATPFTVTFTWLGGGGATPSSQHFTVYGSDGGEDGLPVIASGETSPVPEPGTLGLMTIGAAVAGRRALRRRRNS